MPQTTDRDLALNLIEPLLRREPEAAQRCLELLRRCSPAPQNDFFEQLAILVEEIGNPPEIGQALIAGLTKLLERGGTPEKLLLYLKKLREAGCPTPVLARSAAEKFIPVILSNNDELLTLFIRLYREIGPWGPWPLGQVTNGVLQLLETAGPDVAVDFAAIILNALEQGITEKPLIRLVDRLVPGIRAMPAAKRPWQTAYLRQVMAIDWELGRAFLLGLEKGLRFLREAALNEFITTALSGPNKGERYRHFLGLEAIAARELNHTLQTMVPLSSQRAALHRYLQLRGGFRVALRTLAEIPKSPLARKPASCTDGRAIYLPAEMESGRNRAENRTLYRLLAGWELSLIEAGTFTFDLGAWLEKRAAAANPAPPAGTSPLAPPAALRYSDYYALFSLFPDPGLAEKLFEMAEFIRVQAFLTHFYPGFARRLARLDECDPPNPPPQPGRGRQESAALRQPGAEVAASADWLAATYEEVTADPRLETAIKAHRFSFNRGLRLDLVYLARRAAEERAHAWRRQLAERGIRVSKGLLRCLLLDEELTLTPESLKKMLERSGRLRDIRGRKLTRLPAGLDLRKLFPEQRHDHARTDLGEPVPTFWYDEWDFRLHDYLRRRVKLLEHRRLTGDPAFYRDALDEHRGLVRRIRRNFELIRPEAVTILRHWPEGDAFDYDALIEYAIDRRLRRTPEERIYRKRLKAERDVAVFVLVDLSSSTRKTVAADSPKSILEVEKEALVLFCEALERVGDRFAIAGFSGSGRLAAEFFYLKDFDEALNDEIRGRIGALRPEKNTRMGPAVRHAARRLREFPARVKLMIILSDGLPNDQDYSGDYAIADARAAIRESRSAFIHVHAITVNAAATPHLDRLYGDVNHTVIADVRQLPDKLPRIYRALTRN